MAAVQTEGKPKLITSFSNYSPKFNVTAVASRMIASIPKNYLLGLDAIVFTNLDSLPRKRRTSATKSRGRKVRIARAAGLYHPNWQGKPAWIEIFVDQTMADKGVIGLWSRMPFFRDILFSRVLFHEIGHHIHATARPEFREKEDVAERWQERLLRNYFHSRYRWLFVLATPLKPLIGPLIRKLETEQADAKKGTRQHVLK